MLRFNTSSLQLASPVGQPPPGTGEDGASTVDRDGAVEESDRNRKRRRSQRNAAEDDDKDVVEEETRTRPRRGSSRQRSTRASRSYAESEDSGEEDHGDYGPESRVDSKETENMSESEPNSEQNSEEEEEESGRGRRPSRRAASRVSSSVKEQMDVILESTIANDPDEIFCYPVDEEMAPGYSHIVEKPMDFSRIR